MTPKRALTPQQREKIVCQRIIDENKHKPIRKMVPMDFSMKNIPQQRKETPRRWDEPKENKANKVRQQLADECIGILREEGALTTKALSEKTHRNTAAVSAALRAVPGMMSGHVPGSRSVQTGHYSRETLWMMPVSVSAPHNFRAEA